jgi:ABC-type multidrug transport system ATPase subunit
MTLLVDRVSKRFGDVVALDELAFEVGRGEVFGFLGPNGAGKTTTMRIALGVVRPDAGVISWGGVPPATFRRVGLPPRGARALPADESDRPARLLRLALRRAHAGRHARGP